MSATNFTTAPMTGLYNETTSTDAKVAVGTTSLGTNGTEWVYVKAAAAITQYDWVSIDKSFNATSGTKTLLDRLDTSVGFAQVAFASADYGWVAIRGKGISVRVKGTTAVNTALYSTAVAGVLATSTTSQSKMFRIATTTTGSTSTSGKAMVAYWPGRE